MTTSIHSALGEAARAFLSREHQLLIDGRMVASDSGKRTDVVDPATGEVIATVAEASATDVDRAVEAARRALEGSWRKVTPSGRTRMMLRFADLIEANGDELAQRPDMDANQAHMTAQMAEFLARRQLGLSKPKLYDAFGQPL